MELLLRDEGYHREREGVVLGLEAAIDLVELAEEEQGQQAPPPGPMIRMGREIQCLPYAGFFFNIYFSTYLISH